MKELIDPDDNELVGATCNIRSIANSTLDLMKNGLVTNSEIKEALERIQEQTKRISNLYQSKRGY